MTKSKLIELWKNDCEDCEAAKPIVEELEREGLEFGKHNIEDPEGRRLWEEYEEEIDKNSRRQGYEEGYIYTPTFINPQTRGVIAFANRAPIKEEILDTSSSVVSHSLKKLLKLELVKRRKESQTVYYSLVSNEFTKTLRDFII